MGQVLKQGEELRLPPTDLVLGPTARLGLYPDMVQKQIRVSDSNLYAGPTVFCASLPLSSFLFRTFSHSLESSCVSDPSAMEVGCMRFRWLDEGQTDTELKEKKLRVEDALNATKLLRKVLFVVVDAPYLGLYQKLMPLRIALRMTKKRAAGWSRYS